MAFGSQFSEWFQDTPIKGELGTGQFQFWLADSPLVHPQEPFDVFQGWANDLLVQREDSLGGMLSGSPHRVMARTAFNYEPIQVGGTRRVNLWRCQDGVTTAGRWYRGTVEIELNFGEALLALLETLFVTESVTPTGFGDSVHAFEPNRVTARRSVKLQLSLGNGKHQVWHGVVVDSVTVTAAARRIVKVRLDWKCVGFDASLDSPVIDGQAASAQENERCTGLNFLLRLDGGEARLDVNEFSLTYADPVAAAQFNSSGMPAVLAPTGQTSWTIDAMVWWARDDSFDLWSSLVRSMTETRVLFSVTAVVAGKTKTLLFDSGRWVFRSGTPVPMSRESQPFRVAAEKQTADALPTDEQLRVTI